MTKIYKHEKPLFIISLVFSLLVWSALLVGTFGVLLIYILIGFIFYLFVQSAFIAYLKGTGVALSQTQYPDIYDRVKQCCSKLNIEHIPNIYILNADGILNALATKFLRKHYVVLYSDIVDALTKNPNALNFYIGHELGHIKRSHLDWSVFLWPANILPLIGSAYSRAREYTCDLHGLACCDNINDAAQGMAVLAAGTQHWDKLNLADYAGQSQQTGSFWMALHELTGTYPWLCKRMQHIMSVGQEQESVFPQRNLFAWLLSLFVPNIRIGGTSGGIFSLMIVIAMIGILGAIAVPAYQDYLARATVTSSTIISDTIKQAATPYILENQKLPDSLENIGLPENIASDSISEVIITETGFELFMSGNPQIENKTIIYEPYLEAGEVQWKCSGGTLETKYRPSECRE